MYIYCIPMVAVISNHVCCKSLRWDLWCEGNLSGPPRGLTHGTKLTVEELITLNGFCSNGPYHYLFVIIKVNFSKQSDPTRSSFTYLELQKTGFAAEAANYSNIITIKIVVWGNNNTNRGSRISLSEVRRLKSTRLDLTRKLVL